ncbi:hypothetical protein B9G98_00237 [Wickerhamiella sorbophila]|uniref:Yeast cell wall synthesis Kre9/Knh1-like N-terminal domain-containing protein n=1 Tax=Wickerhamiella sorbophila TaxID=45607 RepID=A0A2T0FCC3_9ASCO|nr:hypothetical protein B9G98_00237 [Wickerhamiella sorbophila]PRT52617.1 hypothetical protein B9G98_00237 [Wickerhamiella sorbophila]
MNFLLGLATFASAVLAAPNSIIHPGWGEVINAGNPFNITWTPSSEIASVNLVLREGGKDGADNLTTLYTIASGVTNNGNYEWSVPGKTTTNTDYSIMIVDSADPDNQSTTNYSPYFTVLIEGAGWTKSSSGTAAPSGSSAASGSASASASDPASASGSASDSASGSASGSGLASDSASGSASGSSLASNSTSVTSSGASSGAVSSAVSSAASGSGATSGSKATSKATSAAGSGSASGSASASSSKSSSKSSSDSSAAGSNGAVTKGFSVAAAFAGLIAYLI